MFKYIHQMFLLWTIVMLTACGSATRSSNWTHFRADTFNRAFQLINTRFALSQVWMSDPYRITTASPVIGKDSDGNDVIYIGAADGRFVALNSEDGTEKWNLFFGSLAGGIIASAAVSENNDIFF